MSNVEKVNQAAKNMGDEATASAHTFASTFQTIATAHADYAKKAMQDSSEFFAKLTSVKEPTKLIELDRPDMSISDLIGAIWVGRRPLSSQEQNFRGWQGYPPSM